MSTCSSRTPPVVFELINRQTAFRGRHDLRGDLIMMTETCDKRLLFFSTCQNSTTMIVKAQLETHDTTLRTAVIFLKLKPRSNSSRPVEIGQVVLRVVPPDLRVRACPPLLRALPRVSAAVLEERNQENDSNSGNFSFSTANNIWV